MLFFPNEQRGQEKRTVKSNTTKIKEYEMVYTGTVRLICTKKIKHFQQEAELLIAPS